MDWHGGPSLRHGSLLTSSRDSATVELMGRHVFDAAVMRPVVIAIRKGRDPLAGIVFATKRPAGVIAPVLDGSGKGFREEYWCDNHGLEKGHSTPISYSHDSTMAPDMALPMSIWRMKCVCSPWQGHPRLPVVTLLQASPPHQNSSDLRRIDLCRIPSHQFAAPHVNHKIEIKPHTTHHARQKADVPTANTVWAISAGARHGARLLRKPSQPAEVALP